MLIVAARTWRATKPVRLRRAALSPLQAPGDNVCTCRTLALGDTGRAGLTAASLHSVARSLSTLVHTDSADKGKQRAVEITKEEQFEFDNGSTILPSKQYDEAFREATLSPSTSAICKRYIVSPADLRRLEQYLALLPHDRRKDSNVRSLLGLLPAVRALYTGRRYWTIVDDILTEISELPETEYTDPVNGMPDAFHALVKIVVDNCRQLSRRPRHDSAVTSTHDLRLLRSLFRSTPLLAARTGIDERGKCRLLLQPMLLLAKGIAQFPGELQDRLCWSLCRWFSMDVMPYVRRLGANRPNPLSLPEDMSRISKLGRTILDALKLTGHEQLPHGVVVSEDLAFVAQQLDKCKLCLPHCSVIDSDSRLPGRTGCRNLASTEYRILSLLHRADYAETPVHERKQYALVAMQILQDYRAACSTFDQAAMLLLARVTAILDEHHISIPFQQLRAHVANEQQAQSSSAGNLTLQHLTNANILNTNDVPRQADLRQHLRLRKAILTAIEWRDFHLAISLYRALRAEGVQIWHKPAAPDPVHQQCFTSFFAYCALTSVDGQYPTGYERQQRKDTSFAIQIFLDWRASGNAVPAEATRTLAKVLARERNFLMLHKAWLSALDGVDRLSQPTFVIDFFTQLQNCPRPLGVPETRGERAVQCVDVLISHQRSKDCLTSDVCQIILWNLALNIRDRTITKPYVVNKSISQMHTVYEHVLASLNSNVSGVWPFNAVLRAIASKRIILWPDKMSSTQYAQLIAKDMRKHGYQGDKHTAGSLIFIKLAAMDLVGAYRVCYRALRHRLSVHYKPVLAITLALRKAGHVDRAVKVLKERTQLRDIATDPGQQRLHQALAVITAKVNTAPVPLVLDLTTPVATPDRQQLQPPACPAIAEVPMITARLYPQLFLESFFTPNAPSIDEADRAPTSSIVIEQTRSGSQDDCKTSSSMTALPLEAHPPNISCGSHPPFVPDLLSQVSQDAYSYAFSATSPESTFLDVKRGSSASPSTASSKTPWQFRRLTRAITAASMAHTAAVRRWEVELEALRKAEESRSAGLWRAGRADSGRWHGWTEHAAVPWY